jgi:hypothetical protein
MKNIPHDPKVTNNPLNDKWRRINSEFENNPKNNTTDSVDTEEEVKFHILDTQGPTDTKEEVDAQKRNLGPHDTQIEEEGQDNESTIRPTPFG